jgi:hypothetical protein
MDLKSVPYPEFTREFLTAVPFVLVTWPALLGGFSIWARRGKDPVENQTSTKEKEVAKK